MPNQFEQFKTLTREALLLQDWATMEDEYEAIAVVNELTGQIPVQEFLEDVPVTLTGGDVEVHALSSSEDGTMSHVFVPNNGEVEGLYYRLLWRPESMNLPGDEENSIIWRLCHALKQPGVRYINVEGSLMTENPMAYVTVEGSSIQVNREYDSHDLDLLADDAFTNKLDQVVSDDRKKLQKKLDIVASMFTLPAYSRMPYDKSAIFSHRLSYLNSLRLLEGTVVQTPVVLSRTEGSDLTKVLSVSGASPCNTPEYFSLDWVVSKEGVFADDCRTLSLEFTIAGIGHVSAPYIKGLTKVFEQS